MNPKKNNRRNRRKAKTPVKRNTRLNPIVDTETENDSQPDEHEEDRDEVPESAESEGEGEGEGEEDPHPILPNGEWFMPDLCSTSLTEIIRKFPPYEGDNTGRILAQFPKLKQYTKSDFYLVNTLTGEIDLHDLANSKSVAFPVKRTQQHHYYPNTSLYEKTQRRRVEGQGHPR